MAVQSKEIECLNCNAVYYIQHDMSEKHYEVSYCSFCGVQLELEELVWEDEEEEEYEA